MALEGHIQLYNGIDMTSAYVVVAEVCIKKVEGSGNAAEVYVAVYFNEAIKTAGKSEVVHFNHRAIGALFDTYFADAVVNQTGKNHFSQSYEYLKSLSQYSGFTDV